MRLDMKQMGGGEVLAGAVNGRQTLGRLLAAAATEPDRPAPVFLDFAHVEVATASFLRESVLAFRDAVRGRRSRLYPVIANPNDAVQDDLAELVGPRGDVLMACVLGATGLVTQVAQIGELDPKQQLTFNLVRKHGETDAAALMRAYGEGEGMKHATAWNNRLSALTALGLVVEVSQGRAKRYRPLFEEA